MFLRRAAHTRTPLYIFLTMPPVGVLIDGGAFVLLRASVAGREDLLDLGTNTKDTHHIVASKSCFLGSAGATCRRGNREASQIVGRPWTEWTSLCRPRLAWSEQTVLSELTHRHRQPSGLLLVHPSLLLWSQRPLRLNQDQLR